MFEDFYGKMAIIAVAGVFLFYVFAKKKEGKDRVYLICFVIIFLTGAFLYSFALKANKDQDALISPFFLVLRSFSNSLKAFGGDFNVSLTSKLAKENQIYYAAVIMHFFAAVFLTFSAVFSYFGKNLMNKIRVFWISLGGKYIVIGCDGQAGIFLKNLTPEQRRRTTVIIQPAQIDKKGELTGKGYAVVAVKEIKTNIEKAYSGALKEAGAMRCNFKTRVISMSEQDEINLLIAKIMTDYITGLVKPEKKDGSIVLSGEQEKKASGIKLDARIMYSFLERAEHFSYIENALGKIRFFNPYEVRARKFLWENPITKLIPFYWIDTEKARLKKTYKINNIFVGFGSANKAILKKSIINNQLLNIDYNALVICKDAKKHEKLFINSAIGLFDTMEDGVIIKRGAELLPNPDGNVYLESPSEQNRILFKEADALSAELYDFIISEIRGDQNGKYQPDDFTSIIIALGENKLSVETALELRQKLYEADLLAGKTEGKEYPRVRIFVKIDEETVLADEKILNSAANEITCKIETFGADGEILTEEYIIDEKLDALAKNIANRYDGSTKTATAASEWNTCTQFQRESNRYAAMAIRIKLNLLGFDLIHGSKPDFDCAGVFQTRYGTDAAFNLRARQKKLENSIRLARESGMVIPDTILNLKIKDEIIDLVERNGGAFVDNARNNLAALEHQRWNAFHLANDWTKLPKEKIGAGRAGRQNGAAKQHACITTFHGLTELREIQTNAAKAEIEKRKEQYIEAESLLNTDTIRHDFNTMDFLLDLGGDSLSRMREAEEDPNREYRGILTGSGYYICSLRN